MPMENASELSIVHSLFCLYFKHPFVDGLSNPSFLKRFKSFHTNPLSFFFLISYSLNVTGISPNPIY